MDSLFILPLSILPLSCKALASARLIKNVRFECAVEMFTGPQTGSGQVNVESLPRMFGWSTKSVHPDLKMLRILSLLPSFDIYSLRISLREIGVNIDDVSKLKLSTEKSAELTAYMQSFTRPLIKSIYSDSEQEITTFDDIIKLFRHPDTEVAKQRLEKMASALNISIREIPNFIEDYGDIFLSISYFRHCFDRLEPYVVSCMESLDAGRKHFQIKADSNTMQCYLTVDEYINSISAAVAGGLQSIDSRVGSLWKNASPEDFRAAKKFVEGYHVTLGAALCCLTVKMNAFAQMFPRPHACGAIRIADFMVSEMMPGFEMVKAMQTRYGKLSKGIGADGK